MKVDCIDCGTELKEYPAGWPTNWRGYCTKCKIMWCINRDSLKDLQNKES